MAKNEEREFTISLISTKSATAKVRAHNLKEAQEKAEWGEWYLVEEDTNMEYANEVNDGWVFGSVISDSLGNEF